MKVKTTYICEICNSETGDRDACLACEAQGTGDAFSIGDEVEFLITHFLHLRHPSGLKEGSWAKGIITRIKFCRRTHQVVYYSIRQGHHGYILKPVDPADVRVPSN